MLILPIQVTHNIVSHTVKAFNVNHTRDGSGRPLIDQKPDFYITDANVQPAGDKVMALLPEGAQSDGTLVMHTRTTMHMADNVNGSSSGLQTYIRHNGNVWKVWKVQDWKPHATIGRYILTRYVDVTGQIV